MNKVKSLSDVIAEARAEFEAMPAHVKAQVERNRALRQFADAQENGVTRFKRLRKGQRTAAPLFPNELPTTKTG